MNELISVVIITYNQEDTIGRCIEAIVSQKCDCNFEIIIGDDCSKDGTADVCRGYAERYPDVIRLIINKENKGIVDNYFDCVRMARGKYLMECGGDDKWMPGRMQRCIDVMRAHPEVGMVLSAKQSYEEGSGKMLPLEPTKWQEGVYDGEELTYSSAEMRGAPNGYSAMTRLDWLKEMMEKHPCFYHGREFVLEDLQIAVMMGLKGKMYYLAEPTFYYSVNPDNISINIDERKRYRFESNALKMLVGLIEELQLDKQRLVPALQHRAFTVLMHVFRLHDKALYDKTIDDFSHWGIKNDRLSLQVVTTIMSNNTLWSAALKVRKLFVLCKKFL